MPDDLGQSGCSRPKLGPGDAAYILAWCAWRNAYACLGETDEEDTRKAFVRWWNESGEVLLADWGYRVLDSPDTPQEVRDA